MIQSINSQRRVAAIHDISGFGRCSLTVIIPTLSAMGVQTCPVPTAVLSTHTGGLGDVAMRDLTDFIPAALEHYKNLHLDFDAVYTGFLGSQAQIDHCLEFFKAFPKALIVVDPVMGDHGKPYKTCDKALQQRMGELVRAADIITPNLTEAYILLGQDYDFGPMTHSHAKSLLARLSEKGPSMVVITGVQLATGEMANIGYDRNRGAYWYVPCDSVPVSYPGTGDIYASVLVGSILTGDSLSLAMGRASSFVELAIKTTFSYGTDTRYGVMLENALPWLTHKEILKNFKIL